MAGFWKDGVYYEARPAAWRTCGICGDKFQLTDRWHNGYFCSFNCCAARREQLRPTEDEDTYY